MSDNVGTNKVGSTLHDVRIGFLSGLGEASVQKLLRQPSIDDIVQHMRLTGVNSIASKRSLRSLIRGIVVCRYTSLVRTAGASVDQLIGLADACHAVCTTADLTFIRNGLADRSDVVVWRSCHDTKTLHDTYFYEAPKEPTVAERLEGRCLKHYEVSPTGVKLDFDNGESVELLYVSDTDDSSKYQGGA